MNYSDEDGFLTIDELQTYLGSFLRMLLGCSFSTASQRGYGVTTEIVTTTCQTLAREISENFQLKLIDFQTFGDWYNEGGYKIIPWIELIDMSKWVKITAVNAVSRSSAPNFNTSGIVTLDQNNNKIENGDNEDSDDSNDNDNNNNNDDEENDYDVININDNNNNTSLFRSNSDASDPAFTLILYKRNGQYVAPILPDTVTAVLELSLNSGLSKIDSEKINQVLLASCGNDLLLNRKEFDRFLNRIHPQRRKQYHADISARARRGETPTSPFSEKNLDAFSSLFNVYDRTDKGVVDAIEIAIGLGLLCSG